VLQVCIYSAPVRFDESFSEDKVEEFNQSCHIFLCKKIENPWEDDETMVLVFGTVILFVVNNIHREIVCIPPPPFFIENYTLSQIG